MGIDVSTTANKVGKTKERKAVIMLRRAVVALAVLFCFNISILPAFAEDQSTQSNTGGVSLEDAKKLKDTAQFLGNAFGIKPKEEQPAPQPVQPQQKTIADVADKGLEMVKGFVVALSETLKKIAPDVWRVMIRQQFAKAVSGLVVPWGIISLVLVYVLLIKKLWSKQAVIARMDNPKDSDEKEAHLWLTTVAPTLVVFCLAVWGFNRLSDSILLLINPEYYAIKDLLEMILR